MTSFLLYTFVLYTSFVNNIVFGHRAQSVALLYCLLKHNEVCSRHTLPKGISFVFYRLNSIQNRYVVENALKTSLHAAPIMGEINSKKQFKRFPNIGATTSVYKPASPKLPVLGGMTMLSRAEKGLCSGTAYGRQMVLLDKEVLLT